MIQGFRKLVDFPTDRPDQLADLETRLKSRSIRHAHHLYRFAGPDHSETVWRVYVYCQHLGFAQDELARMEMKSKVVSIGGKGNA